MAGTARAGHHADADGDLQRMAGRHGDRFRLNALPQPFGQLQPLLRLAERRDDGKLFAAHAAEQIVDVQIGGDRTGKRHQCLIATGVAETVIDRFEIVDVEHHDAHQLAFLIDHPLAALHKRIARQHVGQRIVIRHVLQRAQQRVARIVHAGDGDRPQRQQRDAGRMDTAFCSTFMSSVVLSNPKSIARWHHST